MREVRGQSPPCSADLLLGLHHGKSNSTDESITEMDEDGGAVIHENGGLGPARVSRFTCRNGSTAFHTQPAGLLYHITS